MRLVSILADMARPETARRVHAAVLALAERGGPDALTMEGIAAEAGVGKQTLYRSWPSVAAVVFDALAAESAAHGAAQEGGSVMQMLQDTITEISSEPRATLLRVLAASIQSDAEIARQFRDRLLAPQLEQVADLVAAAGFPDPRTSAELLLAPIFYRWFMGLPQFGDAERYEHARRIRALRPEAEARPASRTHPAPRKDGRAPS